RGSLPLRLARDPVSSIAIPCCTPFGRSRSAAGDEAARIRKATGWFCGCVATCCASAADVGNPYNRFCISRLPSCDGSSRRRNPERPTGFRLRRSSQSRDCGPSGGRSPGANCSSRRHSPFLRCERGGNAARWATRTIRIVAIDFETDPIASGVAATLARPGGNITGVFLDFPDFTAKWMEMLVESNPKLSRAAVLWDPDTGPVQLDSVRKAARTLNVQLEVVEVHRASDFDAAFLMANQLGVSAMVMPSSPLIAPNVQVFAELTFRPRLPAITLFPDFARAGGFLLSGQNPLSMYRVVGVLAGKVARGADPAALPIERPA